MPSSIICQRCHAVNSPTTTICQSCGARFCPNCKLVIDSPNASVCPHCGKKDMTFKTGKYSGSTYVASGVSTAPPSQSYCSNCGSRVEAGVKKCPYCGRLGTLVTQTPRQGYGVMQPAHGAPSYTYTAPAEPEPTTTQKVCSKCGTPIPPGSSLCPIHGKFGGGNVLRQRDTSIEAEAYRRMADRAAGVKEQPAQKPRRTPPEDIYPQMHAGPAAAPQEITYREIPAQEPPRGAGAPMETPEPRTCPSCGSSVPDRSKVCPTCGNNRLPQQKSRPIPKAEEFYKSREATGAYAAGGMDYAPDYGQAMPPGAPPYMPPPADQYYGQPAVQPYEITYPVASPGFIEEVAPGRGRKEKRPKEPKPQRAPKETRMARGERKSPWPMLLALLALVGVIIIAAVLIMDMLKTPQPATMPTNTNPAAAAKPPVISNIQMTDIGKTSATITWVTDKKANSIVIYCLEGGTQCENAKDDSLVTNHNVKLTNLEQGKAYHITVKSMIGDVDASQDAPAALKLGAAADTTPPKVTDVKVVNIIGTGATVTWNTDEPATSQVSYGTSQGYGTYQPEQMDTQLLKSHSVSLYGLPPAMVLHYKVTSRDASGNEASSPDATFTTASTTSSSSDPLAGMVGNAAPDFSLPGTDESTTINLSAYRGKKVIINFWNLDCQYCMQEMPSFQTIRLNNQESAVAMVMINTAVGGFTVDKALVANQVASRNYSFTVALDQYGSTARSFNVTNGIPVTFFLDSNGVVKTYQDGMFRSVNEIQNKLNSYN